VTVENETCADRIDDLIATPAVVKFISAEPLIGPLSLDLTGLDWVIVGGESGPCARPMKPEWVRKLRDDCLSAGIPFFFKQWGGAQKKRSGRLLDGRIWDQIPRREQAVQLALTA
jgi:protein gp37